MGVRFYMSDSEISTNYRNAASKNRQISILAQLNGVGKEQMENKLVELGLIEKSNEDNSEADGTKRNNGVVRSEKDMKKDKAKNVEKDGTKRNNGTYKRKFTDEDWEEIQKKLESGCSFKELTNYYGYKNEAVLRERLETTFDVDLSKYCKNMTLKYKEKLERQEIRNQVIKEIQLDLGEIKSKTEQVSNKLKSGDDIGLAYTLGQLDSMVDTMMRRWKQ